MPELDAQHRAQLAETLETVVADLNNRGAISDGYGWEGIADGLAPLVAEWLADARADALREAADDVPLFEFMLVMDVAAEVAPSQIAAWLRDRADRGGDS